MGFLRISLALPRRFVKQFLPPGIQGSRKKPDNQIMGNIVVINGTGLADYAWEKLPGGKNSLEMVMDTGADLPDVTEKWILCPSGDGRFQFARERGYSPVIREDWTAGELFNALEEIRRDASGIFYLQGDAPLTDPGLSRKMLESHEKYFAHYSFAEGYPAGLCPEILNPSILTTLASMAGDSPLDRGCVFSVISRDMNNFDLETLIAPKDMRLLRISLTGDNWRNFSLLKTIMEKGGKDEKSVLAIIEEQPEILRTFPAYGEFQITNGEIQRPFYLPEFPGNTLENGEMKFLSPEDFSLMMGRLGRFAREGTVNLGFRGEPSLHPRTLELIAAVLEHPGFSVLLETSGLGWKEQTLSVIAKLDVSRIDWIVELDSLDPETYRRVRGEGFREAMETTGALFAAFPDHVWVQAVRMEETEAQMEAFYRHWSEKTKNFIIQKYDDFCGRLPRRKVVDLSPLKRFPCWHLKRDLPVLLDGTVLLCREELEDPRILGNLLKEEPEAIWERGDALHREQTRDLYPGICGDCDEYYTFNY